MAECKHDKRHFYADGDCTCGQEQCAGTPYCHMCVIESLGTPARAAIEADELVEATAKSCEAQAQDSFYAANNTKGSEASTEILRQAGGSAIACAIRIRTEHKGRYTLKPPAEEKKP